MSASHLSLSASHLSLSSRWGDYVPHDHFSFKNGLNALLTVVALVPSFVSTWLLYSHCESRSAAEGPQLAAFLAAACEPALASPILLANSLFFANVTVGFWVIGLLQRSFWLIDPYWTLIPPLLGHLYQLHPRAAPSSYRSTIVLVLLWAWSARLTHNYFRREEWKFGQREDWRYTKMALDFPRLWPLLSFFAVGLAQQPMLVGITLPAYTVHHVVPQPPLGPADALWTLLCVAGLLTARVADDQLHAFMRTNEERVARGEPRIRLLETGLWYYSRHPNYFGEQLWWWALGGFAVSLGQPEMLVGTAFNSLVLSTVTVMTENKMLTRWAPERAELYRQYIRTTSPLIPWFKRGSRKEA